MIGEFFVASSLMWNFTEEEIFEYVAKNNLSGIEFWSQQIQNNNFTLDKINYLQEQYNLKVVLHGKSWDLNLASINENIRELSVKENLRDIDLAKEIGAAEVTIHPGRYSVCCDTESYYTYLRESFDQIIEYSILKNIPISVEIMEKIKKEFITDIKSLKKLMEDMFKDIYTTPDVSHCDSEEEIYYLLDNLANVSKVHISNRQKDMYHTDLMTGIFPMDKIITDIAKRKIPMVLEGMETGSATHFLDKNINYLKEKNLI